MNHIKKTLAVAALALTAFGTAHAGTTFILPDPGAPGVSDVTWTIVDNSKAKKDTDFDDFYTFFVADEQEVSFTADFGSGAGKNAVFAGYALYDYANNTLLDIDLTGGSSLASDTFDLTNGTYQFEIAGTYGAKVAYSGTITGVPVVPEPGTWGLMFAGLAALGAVARRRNKA